MTDFEQVNRGHNASPVEGWTNFAGQARKFHYIPADEPRALCGRWGLSPFVDEDRARAHLQPDNGKPSADDCATCRRKLDARTAAQGQKNETTDG
jgi:hypothetical protein